MRSAVAFFVPYLHLIRTVNMVEEICDRYVATLHHLAAVECCCNNTSRCRLVKPPLIVTPITLLFVYSFKLSPPFLFYFQDRFQQPKLNCIYQSHFRPKMGYFSLVILNVDLLMWPSPMNLTWLWSMFTAVWNILTAVILAECYHVNTHESRPIALPGPHSGTQSYFVCEFALGQLDASSLVSRYITAWFAVVASDVLAKKFQHRLRLWMEH